MNAMRFPLRPRRPEIPVLLAIFGAVLLALAAHGGGGRLVDLCCGLGLLVTVALYAASPTWRLAVVVDDDGCAIVGPKGDRLRLRWDEVVRVLVDEQEGACWVDGGMQGRRIAIPSRGMPSPYVVRGHAEATRAVRTHAGAKVQLVDKLGPDVPVLEVVDAHAPEGPKP